MKREAWKGKMARLRMLERREKVLFEFEWTKA